MMRRTLRFVLAAAAVMACTLVLRADDKIAAGDAELQFQLGNLLSDETRYPEALSLYADSLWSAGLFDEADDVYSQALSINKESSRARFGIARSLATRTKLDEALTEAQAAAAMAPRDGEIHAEIGAIYQRLHRFDEAANAYNNFINLLPNNDRSDKAAWTRSQVKFLKAFEGRSPVEIDPQDLESIHTMPFRLVDDKIVIQARVNGGRQQDFILDTGSEETVIS